MRKILSICVLFFIVSGVQAQIEVAKLVGKNSSDYKLGYGAFLKFGYPISEASDISLEGSALFFFAKSGGGDGFGLMMLKAGYRYTLNGTGLGFYVQPQAGYNFYEDKENHPGGPYKGPVWAVGTGYLFAPSGVINFDLGIRYESAVYEGGSANYIALRLAHNFTLGKRDTY